VMDFLGNVNVFHGRVQKGRAMLGDFAIDYPDYQHDESRPATLYMRPHELDIDRVRNGVPVMPARVQRINPTGSVAKIGLVASDLGLDINVDLSPDRYAELQLKTGELVYVRPKRARVFVPETNDYVI